MKELISSNIKQNLNEKVKDLDIYNYIRKDLNKDICQIDYCSNNDNDNEKEGEIIQNKKLECLSNEKISDFIGGVLANAEKISPKKKSESTIIDANNNNNNNNSEIPISRLSDREAIKSILNNKGK